MSLLKRSFGTKGSGELAGSNARAAGTARRLVHAAGAQRVRLGLTGLATIFLLVLVAAAGMRPTVATATATHTDLQAEPLAVLGVAPGAGSTNLARNAPPAARPGLPAAPAARRT